MAKHQLVCLRAPQLCQFCTLKVPKNDFHEHIYQCGSRTKSCPLCKKNIMIRDYEFHESSCGLTPQRAPPKPSLATKQPETKPKQAEPKGKISSSSSSQKLTHDCSGDSKTCKCGQPHKPKLPDFKAPSAPKKQELPKKQPIDISNPPPNLPSRRPEPRKDYVEIKAPEPKFQPDEEFDFGEDEELIDDCNFKNSFAEFQFKKRDHLVLSGFFGFLSFYFQRSLGKQGT